MKYEEEFLKLKQLFKKDNDKFSKSEIIKNDEIKNTLHNLSIKYGATNVYSLLYDFFSNLSRYSRKIENSVIKIIEMKEKNYETEIYSIGWLAGFHRM